ncbi:hypothetical protein D0B54_20260 [Solimonas sp. K1W22B-7]|nr:hypothetical protein D0B54_20260 [Solimonas sp. K1W22B-7]
MEMRSSETLVIRGSRLNSLFVLFASLIFVFLGVMSLEDHPILAWSGIGFFGLGIPVGLIFLVRPPELRLDSQGFQMVSLFKPAVFTWAEVEGFYMTETSGTKMIGIVFSPDCEKLRRSRRWTEAFTGVAGAVPDMYTRPASEICELLNEWRRRHIGR